MRRRCRLFRSILLKIIRRVPYRFLTALLAAGIAFAQPSDQPIPAEDDPAYFVANAHQPLKCSKSHLDPRLDFHFRFFTGYTIDIPLKQLVAPQNTFEVVLDVRPLSDLEQEPFLYRDSIRIGSVEKGLRGEVSLTGAFVVGEGDYEVAWHIKDSYGRGCSLAWEIEAKLPRRSQDVKLSMKPGEIDSAYTNLFGREVNVRATQGPDYRVKILASFDSPRRRRQAMLHIGDVLPVLAALRALLRDPRYVQFSVLAYSVEDQEVLLRQGFEDGIDFPALGEAVKKLSPATVGFEQLGENKDRDFLADLIVGELENTEDVDALIFLGADSLLFERIPKELLEGISNRDYPVYFLKTAWHPWSGATSDAVRKLKGKIYQFRTPRDLSEAIEKMAEDMQRREGLGRVEATH